MKKSRPQSAAPYSGQVFPVGSEVLIGRPSLWNNCAGRVESVTNGLHRIRVLSRDKETYPQGFLVDCSGDFLSVYL